MENAEKNLPDGVLYGLYIQVICHVKAFVFGTCKKNILIHSLMSDDE